MLVPAAMAVVVLVDPGYRLHALVVAAGFLVGCALAWGLARAGRVQAASVVIVVWSLAWTAALSVDAGGVRATATFVPYVLTAGVLFGRRGAYAATAAVALLTLALAGAEAAGLLRPTALPLSPWSHWAIRFLAVALSLIALALGSNALRTALHTAREELTERLRIEQQQAALVHDLQERVKKLRLLHSCARLLRPGMPLTAARLDEIVALIPPAWQFPEDCAARITYREFEARSSNWRPSPHRLAAPIRTDEATGAIEVVYLGEHPASAEGPFLAEERQLIDSLAEMLQSQLQREFADGVRHSLEDQLRQSQKMEALGTLAGGIAHDFNNILTAIGGNVELARSEIQADGSDARHALDEIARAHARAKGMVQRILDFSRRQEAARRPVALGPIIDEVLDLLRAGLPSTITLRADCPATLPLVLADTTQVHQVLMNLGTNAIHAMQSRGGTLDVELATQTLSAGDVPMLGAGAYVRIRVRDTGSGIAPEVRQRIFEPFFTTKGRDGTGLGLSVASGIMHEHGGAITVMSTPGIGTTFDVWFPAQAAPASAAPTTPATGPVRGHGEHLLYVDDDPALRTVMSRLIQRLGYRCTPVEGGDAALALVRATPDAYDAVITDLEMPGLNGLALAAELVRVRADLPVAVASGHEAPPATTHVDVWIRKPTTLPELGESIATLLHARV